MALSEISRLAHESEVRRSVLHNRVRRAGGRARAAMPSTLADYLKMAAASAMGFWILTALLAYLSPVEPLHALAALGVTFSAQATLYKIKLATDPSYEIRGCGCGKGRADETAAVLRSRESATLGVPNSVLAILLYAGLIASLAGGYHDGAVALAGLAVAASAYFGYVMVQAREPVRDVRQHRCAQYPDPLAARVASARRLSLAALTVKPRRYRCSGRPVAP